MLSRRTILIAAVIAGALGLSPAFAASPQPFNAQAFAEAQKAGRPILVAIHASWCPTCKAQKPIMDALLHEPKRKDLTLFVADFDTEAALKKRLRIVQQSTFVVFKGGKEVGRSTGDTDRASIAALFDKAL